LAGAATRLAWLANVAGRQNYHRQSAACHALTALLSRRIGRIVVISSLKFDEMLKILQKDSNVGDLH
jgi:hypothetical protein